MIEFDTGRTRERVIEDRLAFRFAGFTRAGFAVAMLVTLVFMVWALASPRSAGNVFGIYSTQSFSLLAVFTYGLGWLTYCVVNRQPLRAKLANLILTTGTLVILLGLIELPATLGWIDYRKIISPPVSILFTRIKPWNNPSNLLDRELIHLHRPHQRVAGDTVGDLVHWLGISTDRRYEINLQYDGNGFRNDHDISQAPIVVIGDSFVEAGLVSQSALFSTRLAGLLNVETVNLGQSGYGPQQEVVVLRRYGLEMRPRVVLWFFFEGNDLLDVTRYQRSMKDWNRLAAERDSLKDRSFVNNALLALAGLTSPKLSVDSDEARRRSCRFSPATRPEDATLYFGYGAAPLSDDELEGLKTAQSSLLEAKRLCVDSGAELVVAYVPTKFRVYRDLCEFPDDGYGKIWQLNDLPSRMDGWCKSNAIPFFDLTPSLKEAAAKGELVYFPDDGHWNEKGHEVVANTVGSLLRANAFAGDNAPDARSGRRQTEDPR